MSSLDALSCAIQHIIAPAIAARRSARVWHAACATGEEPLSLAMLLADAGLLAQTSIIATDISERSLERARSADRGARSLRRMDLSLSRMAERWLFREGDRVRVSQALLDAVHFHRVNLLDENEVMALGKFDVVFCRNVLIYFRVLVVRRVATNLARAITPGGWLIIGASESLLRFGTLFRGEERGGVFLYRPEDSR
jgi:chemotaxis protein methyltransferase CheR